MPKIVKNIRIEKEDWERIPSKNKSEFVRDVIQRYIHNELVSSPDILAIQREAVLLRERVEDLKRDKERLQAELDRIKPLYLPPRRWWRFWKKD
jgi:hypothetical protein